MLSISPGVAQGCFELLDIVSRNELSTLQIAQSFKSFGSLDRAIIIDAAQSLGWIREGEKGIVVLTPAGSHVLGLAQYQPRLRQTLATYIDVERPAWIQNAPFGRDRVLAFIPRNIGQVFIEAGLTDSTEPEVVSFWDRLSVIARGQTSEYLIAIGRVGERLSIRHEERRTTQRPRWVAIENNADGYDILSVVGLRDSRLLRIEVKASTQGLDGALILSRSEWERAQEAENQVFHLWNLANDKTPEIAVLQLKEIELHLPTDNGNGVWNSVEIPFSTFEDRFSPEAYDEKLLGRGNPF